MANRALTSEVFPASRLSPKRLLDLKRIRDIEAAWLAETPAGALMACAGAAVAEVALKLWRRMPADTPVVLLVGPGNNGGDALVAGRLLLKAGLAVKAAVFAGLDKRPPAAPDARAAWVAWRATGQDFGRLADAKNWLQGPALVIDGLFGIGLARPLADEAAELAVLLADRPESVKVLAIDVPSGLDADTGGVVGDGAVVSADVTVTMIADKPGLHTGPGLVHAGEVWVAPLSVEPWVLASEEDVEAVPVRLDQAAVAAMLPSQPVDAHKGTAGDVLVMGGRLGMGGAARLAARGASGAGAGRVWIATEAVHGEDGASSETAGSVDVMHPEVMRWGMPLEREGARSMVGVEQTQPERQAQVQRQADDQGGMQTRDKLEAAGVNDATEGAANAIGWPGNRPVLVVGCGLGQDTVARAWLDAAMDAGLPLVLDADALTLLSGSLADQADQRSQETKNKEALYVSGQALVEREVQADDARTVTPSDQVSVEPNQGTTQPKLRIMTPHPLEAARLLGISVPAVQADRIGAARRLAARYRSWVVLKGAGTVIAAPDGRVAVNSSGHPVLGTGGTGDVLAGTIGALLARLLRAAVPPEEAAWRAACIGVWMHGRAGEYAVANAGPMGVSASMLPEAYPLILGDCYRAR
ncbi:MAG: NAD(P)H-hydrate epimerase [Lautropia sp.]|nr:NAD(P)H-hydrate epimerase [Lautropia sp.]